MKGETLFLSNIRQIDINLSSKTEEEIIFRIINFGNIYYFAQEISTGCIFPTYSFGANYTSTSMPVRTYSYIRLGKYFVFCPLEGSDDTFKYCLDEAFISGKKKTYRQPSIKEVNKYLEEKKGDIIWKRKIEEMEAQNEYMCDITLIKEKINQLRNNDNVLDIDFNKVKPDYIEYVPSIDLKSIENFGYDLSTQDNLCNLISREEEKKKIIKTVAIRNKSVLLIGEPGSGKTSIPESLALDIKNRRSPWLNDKIIFYLDTASLVSGTKYRGEFEDKFLEFINFCTEYKDRIIIFIDEMHTLYGLGRTSDSSIDAMNILKPYITKGDLTIIGATTEKEYQEYMANDPAFLRRFEEVKVSVPDRNMNIQIILSYINDLQTKYKIKLDISENIIQDIADFIIEVTDPKHQRVVGINKVVNPTISKNIIEEAFAEAVYNNQNMVTLDDICLAILSSDKFPLTYRKTIAEKLKNKITGIVKSEPKKFITFESKKLTLIK